MIAGEIGEDREVEPTHPRSSRRKFVRQLGVALGIGLGVLLPASNAWAGSQCC